MKFRFAYFKRIVLPLLAIFLLLLGLIPQASKFNYDYRKGTPWEYDDLVAEFDFPILKSASELQSDSQGSDERTVPYFLFDEEVPSALRRTVLSSWPYLLPVSLQEEVLSDLNTVYERGVVADAVLDKLGGAEKNPTVYIERGKVRRKEAVSNVFTASEARRTLIGSLSRDRDWRSLDTILSLIGIPDPLTPNLTYDQVKTELVRSNRSDVGSPTKDLVKFGDVIVERGGLITDEVMQKLDSYRSAFDELRKSGVGAGRWEILGHLIMSLAIVLIFYFCVLYSNPDILRERNRFHYLCLIFALASTVTLLIERNNSQFLYLVPFTLTTLYLLAFFKKRVVLPVYIVSLLPLLIFAHNGLELFVMFLVSGIVTMYVFDYFNRGWRQFLTAFIAFLSVTVVYLGFRLFLGDDQNILRTVLMLFIGSFLSVAGYPLIFLFEILFNLVSGSRLMELCDTNNKLLRQLAEKAPGTFQHSLQVMNMAEAACREIGADSLLVRTGALYHDIGKMNNPRCFIENEGQFPGLKPYHDGLSPHESAIQIVRHVPDGLEIAEKHYLPSVVREFIRTHHGTSSARYFYTQYLNAGGDPALASDFCYDGAKPSTREQTVLMLCDSVEAASRTMKDHTPEACTELVSKIVQGKIADGQLNDSMLSVKDLNTVQQFLSRYLSQMYHGRIEYPKLNKTASRNLRGR